MKLSLPGSRYLWGHYSAYHRCPNKLYYISKSQIPTFMLSGQSKNTKYQLMLNLHSQMIKRSIMCFFFSVKQVVWMQLSTIIVELCKEAFYFQSNSKENYKMTVWPQFSIFKQNFGNIQTSKFPSEKKKVSWPLGNFLESMVILNMSVNFKVPPFKHSFFSLSLYFGGALWLHQNKWNTVEVTFQDFQD